jgi:tetratricopeptide (TPR) repeat protein
MSSARVEALKKFIASRPDDPFPRYGLALEYKNADRLAEARVEFETLMGAHPDYTAAYLHAGNVVLALGDRGEARAIFERGVQACIRRGDGHARGELEGALALLGSEG